MPAIKSITVSCNDCDKEFPAPFFLSDSRAFQVVTRGTTTATCPECKTVITCTKENTRYALQEAIAKG